MADNWYFSMAAMLAEPFFESAERKSDERPMEETHKGSKAVRTFYTLVSHVYLPSVRWKQQKMNDDHRSSEWYT